MNTIQRFLVHHVLLILVSVAIITVSAIVIMHS
jgi:hypothetical protein